MLKSIIYILFFFTCISFGQNATLANVFFNNGEFSKALVEYNKILVKQPHRTDYFIKKIKCHQELEQYSIAQKALTHKLSKRFSQPQLYVELGYNYTLQKDCVVTVEPGIYIPGWGGIRIEDDVIITESGCEVITHSPRELISI